MSLERVIERRKEIETFEKLKAELHPAQVEHGPGPQGRLILLMRAANTPVDTIAKNLNLTPEQVRKIERAQWFKREMLELVKQRGGIIVEELIKQHGPDAVAKMVHLMHSPTVKPEVQQKSAMYILDKIIPNKLDVVRTQTLPPAVAAREIEALELEILEIKNGHNRTAPDGDTKPEAGVSILAEAT